MVEETKKEEDTEDILTKLSMPGSSLREETLQKAKEAIAQQGDEPTRLGTVAPAQATEEVSAPVNEVQEESISEGEYVEEESSPSEMTYDPQVDVQPTSVNEAMQEQPAEQPTQEVVNEPAEDILTKLTMPSQDVSAPQGESGKTESSGTLQDLDVDEVKKLAESIFNSDYSEKKKKV